MTRKTKTAEIAELVEQLPAPQALVELKAEQTRLQQDQQLLQQWQAANAALVEAQQQMDAIEEQRAQRIAEIKAMIPSAAPEEAVAEMRTKAKTAFGEWLAKHYPNPRARRAVEMLVDIDGYGVAADATEIDAAPELIEEARKQAESNVTFADIIRDIATYITTAKDGEEDVFTADEKLSLNFYLLPSEKRTKRTPSTTPSTRNTDNVRTIEQRNLIWPGTEIRVNVSKRASGTIVVMGRAKANLRDQLAKMGMEVSNETVDTVMAKVWAESSAQADVQ